MQKTIKSLYDTLWVSKEFISEKRLYLNGIFLYLAFSRYTMVPFFDFIHNLILSRRTRKIPGDIVECGVWKGGMIAAICRLERSRRHLVLCDSFEGLPPVKPIDGEKALRWQSNRTGKSYFNNCTASVSDVLDALEMANCTSFKIQKGWFEDTLPEMDDGLEISLLRLDGDWYESTLTCLKHLFPKVSTGGIVIIDDYYDWDGCSKAVHDYLSSESLSNKINQLGKVAYIVK